MPEEGDAALKDETPTVNCESGEDDPTTRRAEVEFRRCVKSRQGVKVRL